LSLDCPNDFRREVWIRNGFHIHVQVGAHVGHQRGQKVNHGGALVGNQKSFVLVVVVVPRIQTSQGLIFRHIVLFHQRSIVLVARADPLGDGRVNFAAVRVHVGTAKPLQQTQQRPQDRFAVCQIGTATFPVDASERNGILPVQLIHHLTKKTRFGQDDINRNKLGILGVLLLARLGSPWRVLSPEARFIFYLKTISLLLPNSELDYIGSFFCAEVIRHFSRTSCCLEE